MQDSADDTTARGGRIREDRATHLQGRRSMSVSSRPPRSLLLVAQVRVQVRVRVRVRVVPLWAGAVGCQLEC